MIGLLSGHSVRLIESITNGCTGTWMEGEDEGGCEGGDGGEGEFL